MKEPSASLAAHGWALASRKAYPTGTNPSILDPPRYILPVSVDTSGATAGQYLYGSLGGVAVLQPSHGYYLMSQETNAGDQWYDQDTTLAAAGDLTIDHAAWYDTSYHQCHRVGVLRPPWMLWWHR